MFAAEAVIFWHLFIILKVALRTLPVKQVHSLLVLFFVDTLDPLFYAS